jgi:hypothetical protein
MQQVKLPKNIAVQRATSAKRALHSLPTEQDGPEDDLAKEIVPKS